MRYVVLGSSAAGINGVRELRRLDKEAEIVLISKDEAIYSRCILHHYLGGERDMDRLCFAEKDFETLYHVLWMKGRNCVGLKREEKKVLLEDGEEVSYDKLLIATGSHTFIPPVKNLKEAANVAGFRNIEDMEVLREAAKTAKHIVVMGAGLVGLDCASGFFGVGSLRDNGGNGRVAFVQTIGQARRHNLSGGIQKAGGQPILWRRDRGSHTGRESPDYGDYLNRREKASL